MSKDKKPLNILIISFDWRNLFENNFNELKSKFERDRLDTDFNNFFLISWSNKFYYQKKGNFVAEHRKARFKHLRIFYDFLLIFLVPFVLWKRKFRPDVIWIKEFPILLSVFIPKLIFKSKVILLLSATPTTLVKTRKLGKPKVLYQLFAEFLGKYVVDYFFANGQATKNYLVNLGINKDKIEIKTGNVIDRDKKFIEKSSKGRIRSKYNISVEKKIILTVGRLEPEKGYDRLFKALKDLKRNDLILFVLGEGSLDKELKNLARELKIDKQVVFVGNVDRQNIWNYYQDADIFMLLSYSDGCPTVVREAMYMGVPVVGSRIASIEAFLGKYNERGLLWIPKEGIEKLSNILDECFSNNDKINKIIKEAQQYVIDEIAGDYTVNDYIK